MTCARCAAHHARCTSELLHPLRARALKGVVVPFVDLHFPAKNEHDPVAHGVQEVAVVRHQDDGLRPLLQEVLEPDDTWKTRRIIRALSRDYNGIATGL